MVAPDPTGSDLRPLRASPASAVEQLGVPHPIRKIKNSLVYLGASNLRRYYESGSGTIAGAGHVKPPSRRQCDSLGDRARICLLAVHSLTEAVTTEGSPIAPLGQKNITQLAPKEQLKDEAVGTSVGKQKQTEERSL